MYLGRKWLVDFSVGKTQLVSFDRSDNTGAIDVKINMSILEEESPFKMLRWTFFFLIGLGLLHYYLLRCSG